MLDHFPEARTGASFAARAAVEALERQAAAKPTCAPRARPVNGPERQKSSHGLSDKDSACCRQSPASRFRGRRSHSRWGRPQHANCSTFPRRGQRRCRSPRLLGTTGALAGAATKAAPAASAATAAMEDTARRGMASLLEPLAAAAGEDMLSVKATVMESAAQNTAKVFEVKATANILPYASIR